MNNKQRNVLLGTTVASMVAVAGMGINSYANYKENKELIEFNKNLIAQVQELQNNQVKVVDVYYEQIQEINKSRVTLNIFDSDYTTFRTTLKEDKSINPLETTVRLKWKYKVDLDVVGMETVNKGEYIEFNIDRSLIGISDVIIDAPQTTSDTNFFNKFAGKRIEDINNKSIKAAYDSINILAKNDFDKRYENIINNIEAKLSYLYGVEQEYIKVEVK